jgi:hypothetical protein
LVVPLTCSTKSGPVVREQTKPSDEFLNREIFVTSIREDIDNEVEKIV